MALHRADPMKKGLQRFVVSNNPEDYVLKYGSKEHPESMVTLVQEIFKMISKYEIEDMEKGDLWGGYIEMCNDKATRITIKNIIVCTLKNYKDQLISGKITEEEQKYCKKQINLFNKMNNELSEIAKNREEYKTTDIAKRKIVPFPIDEEELRAL